MLIIDTIKYSINKFKYTVHNNPVHSHSHPPTKHEFPGNFSKETSLSDWASEGRCTFQNIQFPTSIPNFNSTSPGLSGKMFFAHCPTPLPFK